MLSYVFAAIWAVLLLASLAVAFFVNDKYGITASVASAAAMVVSLVLTTNIYLSIFAQVAVAGIIVSVPLLWYALAGKANTDTRIKKGRANIRALIGQRCLVTEEISNIKNTGLVKFKGNVWSAMSVNENDFIEEGTIVYVHYVEGVKLVCSREK